LIRTTRRTWTAIGFIAPRFGRATSSSARGRPKSAAPKQATNIRLDPDVFDHDRATDPGRQSRINQALRKAAGLGKR
jgi:uncharacterized protein (DUF4415 family)